MEVGQQFWQYVRIINCSGTPYAGYQDYEDSVAAGALLVDEVAANKKPPG